MRDNQSRAHDARCTMYDVECHLNVPRPFDHVLLKISKNEYQEPIGDGTSWLSRQGQGPAPDGHTAGRSANATGPYSGAIIRIICRNQGYLSELTISSPRSGQEISEYCPQGNEIDGDVRVDGDVQDYVGRDCQTIVESVIETRE